jgi:hypothetical protein
MTGQDGWLSLAGSRTTAAIADAILSIPGFHLLPPADPGWWEQRVEWSVRMTASGWICRSRLRPAIPSPSVRFTDHCNAP